MIGNGLITRGGMGEVGTTRTAGPTSTRATGPSTLPAPSGAYVSANGVSWVNGQPWAPGSPVYNNALAAAPKVLGSTSNAFHIVGIDDFTGDHQADILFRHDDGDIALWQVAGNQLVNAPKVIG